MKDLIKVLIPILGVILFVVAVFSIQIFFLKFAVGLLGYTLTVSQCFGIILLLDLVGSFFRRRSK